MRLDFMHDQLADGHMIIALQIIHISWDKEHRSAQVARVRNQIVRATHLPEITLKNAHCLGHELSYQAQHASDEFTMQEKIKQNHQFLSHIQGVDLIQNEDHLRIRLIPDSVLHGVPDRSNQPCHCICYANQTVQIRVNGKHSYGSHHWYTQHTYNIAFGSSIPSHIFTAKQFQHVFVREANLW